MFPCSIRHKTELHGDNDDDHDPAGSRRICVRDTAHDMMIADDGHHRGIGGEAGVRSQHEHFEVSLTAATSAGEQWHLSAVAISSASFDHSPTFSAVGIDIPVAAEPACNPTLVHVPPIYSRGGGGNCMLSIMTCPRANTSYLFWYVRLQLSE